MATGDLVKLGTLRFVGAKRKRPTTGNIGALMTVMNNDQLIEIVDTDADESYQLYWREVNDNGKKF